MKRCHKCGRSWTAGKRQPAVKECCDGCSAYLHCCLNCRFHEPALNNQCQIPNTEWVSDRAGANFCDEFEFAESGTLSPEASERQKARDAFNALFGSEAQGKKRAGKKLDELFGQEK